MTCPGLSACLQMKQVFEVGVKSRVGVVESVVLKWSRESEVSLEMGVMSQKESKENLVTPLAPENSFKTPVENFEIYLISSPECLKLLN